MVEGTPRCQGTRRDGTACQAPPHAIGDDGFCWAHAPSKGAARRAARAKGGQNKATAARLAKLVPATLKPTLGVLLTALDEVHAGDLDPKRAGAMAALASAICRLYQTGVIEERIQALEAAQAAQEGKMQA